MGVYYGKELQYFRRVTQGGPLSPTILMWWWTQWCINRFCWWQDGWEVRTGEEGRCYTAPNISTQMMAWLHQLTRSGCREHLIPSPGCSTGWGPEKTLGIQLGCSVTPDTWWGPSRKQLASGGLECMDSPTRPDSGYRFSLLTLVHTWRQGCWRSASRRNIEFNEQGRGRLVGDPPKKTIHKRIKCLSRAWWDCGTAP